jgi:hypothetical protein
LGTLSSEKPLKASLNNPGKLFTEKRFAIPVLFFEWNCKNAAKRSCWLLAVSF